MTGNMIGRVFNNRYTITDRIGVGGMAEVYRAQDNTLGRVVAVKVMLPQYAADPAFTQRFRQEAAAAANLQCPYIVNVYDWGQDQGTYYIVMEYVRGSDLKTAILERGAINQRKVAEIGSQVCQALSVAHKLDIIHRDIKPQNIMVQPDGNVKVMDFGIARAKNTVAAKTSSVLGTAHYISPEQAQGKDLTYASDIYSLGVVMYEAATGQLPFDGPDAISVAMMQVNDEPAPPRTINPDIDPGFESIIMKALDKDPAQRFATSNDMKLALNDFLAGRPVNLGGSSAAETALLGAAAVGAGAAAAGALAQDGTAVMPAYAGEMGDTNNTGKKSYRAGDSSKNKKSKKPIIIAAAIIVAILAIAGIAFALTGNQGDPIPNVVGMTEAEARQTIEEAGFVVDKVNEIYDSRPAGQVVSTDPQAGTRQEKGTKVSLNVSKGTEQVAVPDLRNMTNEEAKRALTSAGLKYDSGTAEYSSDVPQNHVARQEPEANTMVDKDSTVTYYLSLGTESVSVPIVVGSSEGSAIASIQAAGFRYYVTYETSSSVAQGNVISQSPSGGTLEKGETITIVVSSGQDQVTVPDVIENSEAKAKSSLSAVGLNVSVKEQSSETVAKGSVISQSPSAGQKVDPGSTVTITISTGPKTPTPEPSS